MRVITEIEVGDRKVQIKELKIGEIRAWLAGQTGGNDLVDSMLFEEISLPDLLQLTNLTAADIDDIEPSLIDAKLLPKVKEVNPRFFSMRQRVAEMGKQILAQLPSGLQP